MALILFFFIAAEANVIGIDLGSEFIKVSLIKPGKKFVIVENEESKRLTPSSFSISEEGRHFGLKSLNDYIKTPDSSIKLIKQFLGRSINESFVSQKLKELYETKEVIESPYGGISYKINNQTYEIEEIMGMVFEYIQDLSNKFAGTVIKDCAITIPSSFSRSQKLSLLASAEISGLNVIGLIYENTAAALYYALDRTDTDTDHTIVIYNIGNSYIQVSVASIWGYFDKGKYYNNVEMIGHEFNENFGGSSLDYAMAEVVLNDFYSKHGIDLRNNTKSIARLLKEINEAKRVLSANKFTTIKVENIIKGLDLSFVFHRETLNQILNEFKNDLVKPLESLLIRLRISSQSIKSFEVIGGVSKIPMISQMLSEVVQAQFATHIDPNEWSAHGAALFAAKDSATVTVKQIHLTDVFACRITLESKTEKTIVFDQTSQLSSRKIINSKIAEGEALTLVLECGKNIENYYEYSFDTYGNIILEFVLDKNGLSFLSKAYTSSKQKVSFSTKKILPSISESSISKIKEKILFHKSFEAEIEKLKQARNDIETILYYIKEKQESESFQNVTTKTEKSKIEEYIKSLDLWIESQEIIKANISELEGKRLEGVELMYYALEREQEYLVRDRMIAESRKYLNSLYQFMETVTKNATWISKNQVDDGWKTLNETSQWLTEKIEEQSKLNPWDPPVLKSKEFDTKFAELKKKLEKLAYSKPQKKAKN